MISLPSPLAVVSHDAGATNLLIGWLRERTDLILNACMQGPAIELWSSAFPDWSNVSLPEALDGAAMLLSGTSWASTLEHEARRLARRLCVPSVGVIDHWVNYRERFVRKHKLILPDELWVSDEYAVAEATKHFPDLPIRQLSNRYLEGMVEQVNACKTSTGLQAGPHVLYLLEPVRQKWGTDHRPGEFQALDFFIEQLECLGLGRQTEIRLRLHPADSPGKYDAWCEGHNDYNLSVDIHSSLAQSIAWADWVFGCETFAMVVAIYAKRRVVSTMPPWAPPCRLPQREILHLRDLSRMTK